MFFLAVVLSIVFLVLKLTAVIGWAYWLVFLPLIIFGALYAFLLLIGLIAGAAAFGIAKVAKL